MVDIIDLTENEMATLTGGDQAACFVAGAAMGAAVVIAISTGGLGSFGAAIMGLSAWNNARVNGCFR